MACKALPLRAGGGSGGEWSGPRYKLRPGEAKCGQPRIPWQQRGWGPAGGRHLSTWNVQKVPVFKVGGFQRQGAPSWALLELRSWATWQPDLG